MDIRILEYYLAITREGNISAAAEALHISQPSLSRQIRELEEELGVTLFMRGTRRITLTEEGKLLQKRAEGIVRMVHQTTSEIAELKNGISGDIHIGAGESALFRRISDIMKDINTDYPGVRFHITSGDTPDLLRLLDDGLIDFALIFNEFDHSLYRAVTLGRDTLGVIMRRDSELADKDLLSASDLKGKPVITSRSSYPSIQSDTAMRDLNIVGTYSLIFNGAMMARSGAGYVLGLDGLVDTSESSELCFRRFIPDISFNWYMIWKKYQTFAPASQLFLERIKQLYDR